MYAQYSTVLINYAVGQGFISRERIYQLYYTQLLSKIKLTPILA
jgi:hypothetical protein